MSTPGKDNSRNQDWKEHYTSKEMRARFLLSLAETNSLSESSRILKVERNTVAAWRRNYPDFHADVISQISTRSPGDNTPVFVGGSGETKNRFSKANMFLSRYRKTRSMRDAATFCSVTAFHVQEWRNPDSAQFDKEFHELMSSEELLDLWDLEELQMQEARGAPAHYVDGEEVRKATTPNSKVGMFLLERRMTEKYGPPVKEKKVTHNHMHWFTEGGTRHAADVVKSLVEGTDPPPMLVEELDGSTDPS